MTPLAPDTINRTGPRTFTKAGFDAIYDKAVAAGGAGAFLEVPAYYEAERERYLKTLRHVAALDLPRPARVLEVGGGQIAMLCKELFGDDGVVGDVSEKFAEQVTRHGVEFLKLNLLDDDLPPSEHGRFDLVVMCEVIEHLPVPGHQPMQKVRSWLRPGGKALLTTPNLYRFRNVVRMFRGQKIFDRFHFPDGGHCPGHQLEYSAAHLRWQLERAGLRVDYVNLEQLSNRGHSFKARLGRMAARPLFLNPRWRDNLVACATRAN